MSSWYLEGHFGSNNEITRQALIDFPVILGRNQLLALSVASPGISRQHAQIDKRQGGQLSIIDLQSRNGTFVNRERITEAKELKHGDIVHLAELELRVIDEGRVTLPPEGPQGHEVNETMFITKNELAGTFPSGVGELEKLIATKSLNMKFQPIVQGKKLKNYGYEVLGRGCFPGIPESPMALFNIAESIGLEVELSTLMRDLGVALADQYRLKGNIFINTHPNEMRDQDTLLASLKKLRDKFPDIPLVFEVHEQAVADVDALRWFKEELKKMTIRFAFDDFGVGQSRLMDLLEAKPDIVKFDKVLIAGLDQADESRLHLVTHLLDFSEELCIQTLAECVETEAEYKVCDKLGFELYQGYYFAKPDFPAAFT